VRTPVQNPNCTRFRIWPSHAAQISRISSGVNGSIAVSSRSLALISGFQPCNTLRSMISSAAASLSTARSGSRIFARRFGVTSRPDAHSRSLARVNSDRFRSPNAGIRFESTLRL
jgi:uncharacterized protein YhbP (UPF0306 family)